MSCGDEGPSPGARRGAHPRERRRPGPPTPGTGGGNSGSDASARRRLSAAGRNRRVRVIALSLSSSSTHPRAAAQGRRSARPMAPGPLRRRSARRPPARGCRTCAPGGGVSPTGRRRRGESWGGTLRQRDAGGRRVRPVSAAKAGAPRRPRCWAPGALRSLLPEAAGGPSSRVSDLRRLPDARRRRGEKQVIEEPGIPGGAPEPFSWSLHSARTRRDFRRISR